MGYSDFEGLNVWKKSRELKKEIWELVKGFPPIEKYRLIDQLIRCTRSIGNQLAEGHGRRTYPDRLKFAIEARGSVSETLGHLIDAFDCNYISAETLSAFRVKISEIERLMNGYVSYLKEKIKSGSD